MFIYWWVEDIQLPEEPLCWLNRHEESLPGDVRPKNTGWKTTQFGLPLTQGLGKYRTDHMLG